MNKKTALWDSKTGCASSITFFPAGDSQPRPAVLVIPGGGYGVVCEETEGSPVALTFNRLGYHAFVLDYRVAPHSFPAPLNDAVRAVRIIRAHAEEWGIIPDRIVSCGFSAGAHLAGSLGILADESHGNAGDGYDSVSGMVDAMILSYGVLVHAPWSHAGSWHNLSGGDEQIEEQCSLERKVSERTPPAFVWATMGDQIVDCRNSIVFAEAMRKAGRPCELHLYPWGDHGMLLGLDTPDVGGWPTAADRFLQAQWAMRADPVEIRRKYTNSYQYQVEIAAGLTPPRIPG